MTSLTISNLQLSKRKTIALIVTPEATLVVRAPIHTSLEYIERVVAGKQEWITKKIQEALKSGDGVKHKHYISGEQFLFLGKKYTLLVNNADAIVLSDRLEFPEKFRLQGRKQMIAWYTLQAQKIITQRAEEYRNMTGWKYTSLKITKAEKRWGSCSPAGAINFSWKLMMAPVEIIDYVVVHELAHLIKKNHGKYFWQKVESVLPDYKSRRIWLRQHQRELCL